MKRVEGLCPVITLDSSFAVLCSALPAPQRMSDKDMQHMFLNCCSIASVIFERLD
jgi:hypothetical protein